MRYALLVCLCWFGLPVLGAEPKAIDVRGLTVGDSGRLSKNLGFEGNGLYVVRQHLGKVELIVDDRTMLIDMVTYDTIQPSSIVKRPESLPRLPHQIHARGEMKFVVRDSTAGLVDGSDWDPGGKNYVVSRGKIGSRTYFVLTASASRAAAGEPATTEGLQILRATFGEGKALADVTDVIASIVREEGKLTHVSTRGLGIRNPTGAVRKHLVIAYRLGEGENQVATFNQGDEVDLRLALLAPAADEETDDGPSPAARTWRDESGKFSVEATFVRLAGGKVTLRRSDDGRELSVPLEKLSPADRDYVESLKR